MKCKKNIGQDEIGKNISRTEDNLICMQYMDELDISIGCLKVQDIGKKFASINGFFLEYLNAYKIPTGFKKTSDNSLFIQNHLKFPFYCKLLNIVDKRSSKIFSSPEGKCLSFPVIQFHFGSSKDNLISEGYLSALDLCSMEDLKFIKRICSKLNAVLKPFFERRSTSLAEVNCHFGKENDKIFLVDDFTPISLKILPSGSNQVSINPYKIRNIGDFTSYTDVLLNLTNM